jgi:hypothetical protein
MKVSSGRGARRAVIGAAILLSLIFTGCDNPVLDTVAQMRAEAVEKAATAAMKIMTAFSIKDPAVIGTISGTDVAVTVPYGTDLTSLVAVFTITGASVTVNGVTQTSNVTINNFTSPVGYQVAASDGSTQLYTVTVTLGVTTPILSATAAASSITTSTAVSGGTITANGGSAITSSGICWSATENPTVDSCAGKTTDGLASTGSWTSTMTGLTDGATYYVRAYATNAIGMGYGAQVSFTTISKTLPVLSATATVTSIGTTTASSGGTIVTDNDSPITASGICWSTTENPTLSSCDGYTTDGSKSGSWSSSSMTGLSYGTKYNVRAYATNAKGTGYGPQVSFTTRTYTSAPTPAVIGGTAGSGELSVSWTAAPSATSYNVYYSLSSSLTSPVLSSAGSNVTTTSCTLAGLTNFTTAYYVWVVATNTTGDGPASASNHSTVGVPVTGITLQRQADTQSISGGRTADAFVYYSKDTLVATLTPSNATIPSVTWSTSSSTYAAISASGLTCLVTAGSAAGSATVTATASDGQGASVSCAITVTSNAVGQTGPGGGKIVYDQGSYTTGTSTSATYGWRYLETAVASTSRQSIWCSQSIGGLSETFYSGIGYGPSNTAIVLSHYGTATTAAYVAHCYQDSATGGVFSDWFLPSQGEMDYANWRTYAAIPAYYSAWSSTGNSSLSSAEIYANASYDFGSTAFTGWASATAASTGTTKFLVIPMRRF